MPPKPPNPIFAFLAEIISFIILLPVLILRIIIPYNPITFESIIFILLPPLIIARRILRYARMLLFSRPGKYQDFEDRLKVRIDDYFNKRMKTPSFPVPEGLDCAPASFPVLVILSVMRLLGLGNLFGEGETEAIQNPVCPMSNNETIRIQLKQDLDRTITTMQRECAYAFDAAFGSCVEWTPLSVNESMPFAVAMLAGRVFENTQSRWRRAKDLCCYLFRHAVDKIRQVQKVISRTNVVGRLAFTFMVIMNLMGILLLVAGMVVSSALDRSVYSKTLRNPHGALSSLGRTGSVFLFRPFQDMWNTIENCERENHARLWSFHYGVTQLLAQLVYDLAEHGYIQQQLREEICEALVGAGQNFEKMDVLNLKSLDDFIAMFEKENRGRQETQPASTKTTPLLLPNITPATSVAMPQSMGDLEYDWTLLDDEQPLTPPDSPEECRSMNKEGTCIDGLGLTSIQHSMENFGGLNFHHGSMNYSGQDFAFTELKVLLVYLLLHFEFQLKKDEWRHRRSHGESRFGLGMQAEVVFQARDISELTGSSKDRDKRRRRPDCVDIDI